MTDVVGRAIAATKALLQRVSPNRRGVVSIVGGTAIGQIFALGASPVLSRLYGPEEFGSFAVLSALVLTFGTVAALRLELAVPLPEREEEAHSLVATGAVAALCFSAVGTAVVGIAGTRISSAFHQPGLMPWLWIVPASSSVMSIYMLLNQLAIRHRRFSSIGRRNALQSSTTVLAQLLGGLSSLRGGLIFGLGLGQLVGAISLTAGAGLRTDAARQGRRRDRMIASLSRYRRFPLYLGPSGLLNVLGQQLPVLLIAYWFGAQVAGWLGLTQRVLALPVTLVGTAVAQVYLAEISRAARGNREGARRLFLRSTRLLLIVAAALLLVLLTLGPTLFSFVFGATWRESGDYARAMALGLAGQMLGSPLSQTLIAYERQALQLFWDALRVVSIALVVTIAVRAGASAIAAIWLIGVLSALLYGLSWYFSFRVLRAHDEVRQT